MNGGNGEPKHFVLRASDHHGREVRTVRLTTMIAFAGIALGVATALASWAAGQRSLAAAITAEIDRRIEDAEKRAALTHGAIWEAVRGNSETLRNERSRIDLHLSAHDRRTP